MQLGTPYFCPGPKTGCKGDYAKLTHPPTNLDADDEILRLAEEMRASYIYIYIFIYIINQASGCTIAVLAVLLDGTPGPEKPEPSGV